MADNVDTNSHPTSPVQQGFVDNWQGGKSLAECNLHMLNSEDTCDVIFRVGGEGQVIKAHRYVLISRSCVFYSMFTGPLAESSDVKIPDVEVEDFKTFLRYLYSDRTTVDADNVTALLYISRKYAVTGLETKCRSFLSDNLSADNACTILEAAHRFDEKELYDRAFGLIVQKGSEALESPGFQELSRNQVEKISESNELNAHEEELFEAVNKWAESECKRKDLEISPETKRASLGGILKNIRFNSMEMIFIAREVKDSGLLSDTERVDVLDCILTALPEQRYCKYKSKMMVINRLSSGDIGWHANGNIDAISFNCNQEIQLCGLRLYGAEKGTGEYTVTSYFGTEDSVMSHEIQPATQYSGDNETYDVLFSHPADVLADVWYTAAVVITGPCTKMGTKGKDKHTCDDGVEFSFRCSSHSSNQTSNVEGQIPSLLYRTRRPKRNEK